MSNTITDALQKVLDTLKGDPNAIMSITRQGETPEGATIRLINNLITLGKEDK